MIPRRRLLPCAVLIAFLGTAAPAFAATVGAAYTGVGGDAGGLVFIFTAEPGETNEVIAEPAAETAVVFRDPRNPVTLAAYSPGCDQIDDHAVRCSTEAAYSFDGMRLELGDGDDAAAVHGPTGATLEGGDGNDTLRGSDHADWLSGGRGRDYADGGLGSDRLNNNAWQEAEPPETDVWVGGPGVDTLLYRGSLHQVRVDLTNSAPVGAEGELDQASGIENIEGGEQADDLRLGPAGGTLRGGSGADSLLGSGRPDTIFAQGDDEVAAGGGADTIEVDTSYHYPEYGTPRIDCGSLMDRVVFTNLIPPPPGSDMRTGLDARLARDCEAVAARWPDEDRALAWRSGDVDLRARWVRPTQLRLPNGSYYPPLWARLHLADRQASRKTRLASTPRPGDGRMLLRLTRLGVRKLRPGRRHRALLTIQFGRRFRGGYEQAEGMPVRMTAWIRVPRRRYRWSIGT